MKKVVENYLKLLPFLGLTADEAGKISIGGGELGETKAFLVDEKEVFIPTQEFLKTSDKSKVGFHPLAESVIMKPSPMLKAIQDAMNHRLNVVAIIFIESIIQASIAQKKNTLKSKDPNLMSILVGNEDCTADTLAFFKAIFAAILESGDGHKFIRVYFKNGGEIRDEKYTRICSISSPVLEQLERPGVKEIFGIAPKRKKDIQVLTHVIKTAFPGLDTKSYTRGSNDQYVPYMDALLQSLRVLTADINAVARDLKEVEPCASVLEYITTIPSDLEEFEDYDILRNQVPPLAYNDGSGFLTETDNRRVDLVEREETRPTPQPTSTPSYSIYDKPQVAHTQPTPVASTSMVQQLSRQPGTRQVLHAVDSSTDVVQNDYVQTRRHEDRTRNAGYGGGRDRNDRSRDDDRRRGYTSDRSRDDRGRDSRDRDRPRRPHIDDYRDIRDVEDDIVKVKREIKDLERDRCWKDAEDLERGILRDLYDIEDRMKDRGRDRRDDRDRDRDRGRSGIYSSRPAPRGARNDRRDDRDRDRFGRD